MDGPGFDQHMRNTRWLQHNKRGMPCLAVAAAAEQQKRPLQARCSSRKPDRRYRCLQRPALAAFLRRCQNLPARPSSWEAAGRMRTDKMVVWTCPSIEEMSMGPVGLPDDERGSGDAARPQGVSVDPLLAVAGRHCAGALFRQGLQGSCRSDRCAGAVCHCAAGVLRAERALCLYSWAHCRMLLTCIHARLAWRTDLDARATFGREAWKRCASKKVKIVKTPSMSSLVLSRISFA